MFALGFIYVPYVVYYGVGKRYIDGIFERGILIGMVLPDTMHILYSVKCWQWKTMAN